MIDDMNVGDKTSAAMADSSTGTHSSPVHMQPSTWQQEQQPATFP
eukprot:CAMPEP_0170741904 /NCGR_PEP_ID=MMETSP0437-20130122/6466_1 /TAXON_ID=0 /ORGANISM="Sexangularia sp." /LENGTH=44 /DNA_ID= /DNA_START= /DNA_END= /DNA_ORIENTATION=